MKHWKKKVVMALTCATLATSWGFSAYARTIPHTCTAVKGELKSSTPWVTCGNDHHERTAVYYKVCHDCLKPMGEEAIHETQSHILGSPEDIAHKGHFHRFRIYCRVCSYSREVEIICNFEETGRHDSP